MTPARSAAAVQRRTPRLPREDGEGDEAETAAQQLPRRPRRRWLTWRSALLTAILTCAVGFYGGVRTEKSQLASTPRTLSLPTAGATSRFAAGGAAGGAPGGAGGGASFGTVQSVDGNTLVLSEASGTTVKVRLASSTKVTKTQSAKHSAVRPGDTIIVQGAPNARGTVVASTLTDSGSGGSGSGSAGSSSAVGSLFSSGGGG